MTCGEHAAMGQAEIGAVSAAQAEIGAVSAAAPAMPPPGIFAKRSLVQIIYVCK
jgi:hypothetical protein